MNERKFHCPIVRQIDLAPAAYIEIRTRRIDEAAGLSEQLTIGAVAEVFRGIVGVPKMERPSEIEQPAIAPGTTSVSGLRRESEPGQRNGRHAGFEQIPPCQSTHGMIPIPW